MSEHGRPIEIKPGFTDHDAHGYQHGLGPCVCEECKDLHRLHGERFEAKAKRRARERVTRVIGYFAGLFWAMFMAVALIPDHPERWLNQHTFWGTVISYGVVATTSYLIGEAVWKRK